MRGILVSVLGVLVSLDMAAAEGLTLRLESGLAAIDFKETGGFLLETGTPPSSTDFGTFTGGTPRGPDSFSYRGEVNWDLALASGQRLRLGLIGSGLSGSQSEVADVYSWADTSVRYEADGIFASTLTQFRVCPLVNGQPEPCATFRGDVDRSYAELMPQVLLGSKTDGNRTVWFGVQPFTGRLDETTLGIVENTSYTPETRVTELSADATGLLVAFQHESQLKSGATLVFGLGSGGYHMEAASNAYTEGERNSNATRRYGLDGARAQASIGIDYPLSDRLSLGGILRADYWSAQPRVNLDLADPDCVDRTVCRAISPSTDGLAGASDPLLSVSVGVSLTLRM